MASHVAKRYRENQFSHTSCFKHGGGLYPKGLISRNLANEDMDVGKSSHIQHIVMQLGGGPKFKTACKVK